MCARMCVCVCVCARVRVCVVCPSVCTYSNLIVAVTIIHPHTCVHTYIPAVISLRVAYLINQFCAYVCVHV